MPSPPSTNIVGCSSDYECADDQVCQNRQCIIACRANNPCALNANCISKSHRANCECPPGFEGDAFVRCEPEGCRTHQDCPFNRVCMARKCVNPCVYENRCAPNALCIPTNHAAVCRCPDDLPRGNPSSLCEKLDVQVAPPECTQDFECERDLACISEKCVNPCREIAPCDSSAICKVINSVPVRTMMCVCPDNWAPDESGRCQPIQQSLPPPGCASDSECPSTEACVNGVCRDPCDCGRNAQCYVQNHRAVCTCKEGHEGNPNIACYPGNNKLFIIMLLCSYLLNPPLRSKFITILYYCFLQSDVDQTPSVTPTKHVSRASVSIYVFWTKRAAPTQNASFPTIVQNASVDQASVEIPTKLVTFSDADPTRNVLLTKLV